MGANQDNPFAFGVFVSGEQFYDRVEIRADLLRYIRNRQKRDVFDTRLETLTADYRRRHGLGVYATVVSASKTLLDRGILECESGVYRVADPFFAAYLREAVAAL